jgi:haloalkane dehalogenase
MPHGDLPRHIFGRIAYIERGAGPVALFMHGLPLNGYQWRGALERLSSGRRCIAPDFMGLGYTEVAAGRDLAPATQAEMIAAFLNALSIDAVDVIANDSGGAIAQLFTVRNPKRVRTLLLTNCDVHENSPPPAVLPVIEEARRGSYADAFRPPCYGQSLRPLGGRHWRVVLYQPRKPHR